MKHSFKSVDQMLYTTLYNNGYKTQDVYESLVTFIANLNGETYSPEASFEELFREAFRRRGCDEQHINAALIAFLVFVNCGKYTNDMGLAVLHTDDLEKLFDTPHLAYKIYHSTFYKE